MCARSICRMQSTSNHAIICPVNLRSFRVLALGSFVCLTACDPEVMPPPATPSAAKPPASSIPIYGFEEKTIDGEMVRLDKYAGKVILFVNVASKCGFTPQYEGLEALYETHESEGFEVLGFPSDQFGNQEPGHENEIKTFCKSLYGVKFPMFAKTEVNGPNANPLYAYLRKEQPGNFTKDTPGGEKLYEHLQKSTPEVLGTDAVKWNFTKFLVDRKGRVVKRFESMETPETIEPAIVSEIEKH